MSDNVSKINIKPKKSIWKPILLFLLLAAVVCGAAALYVFRDRLNLDAARRYLRRLDTHEVGGDNAFSFDADNLNSYADFDGGLAVAGVTGLTTYEKDGSADALVQVQMTTPQACAGSKLALAYDAGGYALRAVSDKGKTVLELDTERPILDADISADDWFCCSAAEPGYKSVLQVYAPDGSLHYRWLSASQYLPVCAVSPGGKYLAAVGLGQSEGSFTSDVLIFNVGSSEEAERTISVGSELIYDLCFLSDDVICAVGEHTARFFPVSGAMSSFDYANWYLEDFQMGGSGFLTLVLNKHKAGSRCTVMTVGQDGKMIGELENDEQVLSCSAAGNYVAVLTANELTIYDKTMSVYAKTGNSHACTDVLMREDGTVVMLGGGQGNVFVP